MPHPVDLPSPSEVNGAVNVRPAAAAAKSIADKVAETSTGETEHLSSLDDDEKATEVDDLADEGKDIDEKGSGHI